MITAYATLETAITATKRGAYDFLAKPFTPDELKGTVRKAAARIVLAKQARKLANEKRQVRFQFIRVLGHELKAPLNAIEGYLNLLEEHALGDQVAAYDTMIDRSKLRIEGMRKLIYDLLDMTRIESGQKNRELVPLDIGEVVQAAVETQLPVADQRGITIAVHADRPVSMTADRGELEMILNNLLSNAVKYNRDDGRVDVTISRRDDQVRLAVSDTGIGMTGEEAGKLFGEFVRIRNSKTADILGSGLGLSIVKKLAQLYDGQATVESQPGEGTTLTVVLQDPA
jgi:signal transduction histidine kinase